MIFTMIYEVIGTCMLCTTSITILFLLTEQQCNAFGQSVSNTCGDN